VGNSVLFTGWTGGYNAAYVSTCCDDSSVALLNAPAVSFDEAHTDGKDMAWIQSTGLIQTQQFQTYELWTAPFTTDAAQLQPKKLATLEIPGIGADMLTVGDGWVALRHTDSDHHVRLYRAADGAQKVLPAVPGVGWLGGSNHLLIHDGTVWIQGYVEGGAGNDIRWIARFTIDALPAP
jgi:hypothetical protein